MNNIITDDLLATVQSRRGLIEHFKNDTDAVARSLHEYGEWAENELAFLGNFVSTGSTVVDVGGYIGTHALAFSGFVGERGLVISIEAQPLTASLLQKNLLRNSRSNVIVRNAVASDQITTVRLAPIDLGSSHSFGTASAREGAECTGSLPSPEVQKFISVESITIDSLNLDKCDLIKIDAEGMEYEVVCGARATITRLQPIIYAECNDLNGGVKTLAALKDLDYLTYAHVVYAYNKDNFLGNDQDIFPEAREVAIVAAHRTDADRLSEYNVRPCELLLIIESADDLALALLNKPQFMAEVLEPSQASASGGNAFLKRFEKSAGDSAALTLATDQVELQKQALIERNEYIRELDAKVASTELEHRRSIDSLRRSLETQLKTSEMLNSELSIIRGSVSWRITAPLRRLLMIWRRVRGH